MRRGQTEKLQYKGFFYLDGKIIKKILHNYRKTNRRNKRKTV